MKIFFLKMKWNFVYLKTYEISNSRVNLKWQICIFVKFVFFFLSWSYILLDKSFDFPILTTVISSSQEGKTIRCSARKEIFSLEFKQYFFSRIFWKNFNSSFNPALKKKKKIKITLFAKLFTFKNLSK